MGGGYYQQKEVKRGKNKMELLNRMERRYIAKWIFRYHPKPNFKVGNALYNTYDLIEEMETLLKHAPVSIFDVLFTNRIGRYNNIPKNGKQLNHEK